MTIWTTIGLFVALPALALAVTLLNLAVWPRGRRREEGANLHTSSGRLSVLIPARNEAETIEACIESIFESGVDLDEVVVYEDRSTDETAAIVEQMQGVFPRLRLVDGEPLPEGWVGKPHACHRLVEESSGDTLVFVDADTTVEPGGLERLVSLLDDGPAGRAEMVTAVPGQRYGSFGERLVVPLLHLTYTSWLPLSLVWRSSDPRFLAANGQLVAVRREALEEVGGFAAIQGEIVDDMALARRMKEAGRKVVFADGWKMARCRMYDSWREVWQGFSKNLYEGIGGRVGMLGFVVALYLAAFVLPYLGLAGWAVGAVGQTAGVGALAGVGCNVALRGLLALRFRQPVEGLVLHPVGVLALVAIAVNSALWHLRGEIPWAGRVYAARTDRPGQTPDGEKPGGSP